MELTNELNSTYMCSAIDYLNFTDMCSSTEAGGSKFSSRIPEIMYEHSLPKRIISYKLTLLSNEEEPDLVV